MKITAIFLQKKNICVLLKLPVVQIKMPHNLTRVIQNQLATILTVLGTPHHSFPLSYMWDTNFYWKVFNGHSFGLSL